MSCIRLVVEIVKSIERFESLIESKIQPSVLLVSMRENRLNQALTHVFSEEDNAALGKIGLNQARGIPMLMVAWVISVRTG